MVAHSVPARGARPYVVPARGARPYVVPARGARPYVVLAQAGTSQPFGALPHEIPASAGMTAHRPYDIVNVVVAICVLHVDSEYTRTVYVFGLV